MKFKVIAVVCCALALCFALAGCAGVDKSKYTGDWQYSSSDNVDLDAKSMELAKSLGLEIKLTLNEDGTGTFVMLSDTQDVKWEAKSNTEGSMVIGEKSSATMNLNEEATELSLVDGDGGTLKFKR